jgi:hypothetical protein
VESVENIVLVGHWHNESEMTIGAGLLHFVFGRAAVFPVSGPLVLHQNRYSMTKVLIVV